MTLAKKELVDALYRDTLNTIGNSSNIVQHIANELFTNRKKDLEQYQQQWVHLKKKMEQWLDEQHLRYVPNPVGITYWVQTPITDTYQWTITHSLPHHHVATVPGAFFLFHSNTQLTISNMIRLGLGSITPISSNLQNTLDALAQALHSYH